MIGTRASEPIARDRAVSGAKDPNWLIKQIAEIVEQSGEQRRLPSNAATQADCCPGGGGEDRVKSFADRRRKVEKQVVEEEDEDEEEPALKGFRIRLNKHEVSCKAKTERLSGVRTQRHWATTSGGDIGGRAGRRRRRQGCPDADGAGGTGTGTIGGFPPVGRSNR